MMNTLQQLRIFWVISIISVCSQVSKCNENFYTVAVFEDISKTGSLEGTIELFPSSTNNRERPHSFLCFLQKKSKANKKLIAAVLAFPFPFGIVGLHRIYLGTSPHVPVVYIGTLGGVFGLLPLLDFIAILAEKDIDRFIWNKQVFMWMK